MARRSVEPSTSRSGLVRHLAQGERATFRVMMAGQDAPRLFGSGDGDFDGAVPDPEVVAEAWDAWRAEVDFATRFVAQAPSLDITGDDPENQHGSGGGPMSLREVLVGMIEEYARHMGHADLLRERDRRTPWPVIVTSICCLARRADWTKQHPAGSRGWWQRCWDTRRLRGRASLGAPQFRVSQSRGNVTAGAGDPASGQQVTLGP